MNKQPQVTARTRQRFIDAFWDLCQEKSVTQITVGELTRRAGYNRSTFYEYFTDVPDLVTQVEDALFEAVTEDFRNAANTLILEGKTPGADTFRLVFHLLNGKVYALLGPKGDPSFFPRLRTKLLPLMTQTLNLPPDLPGLDYIVAYAYSAILGFLQHWHEQDRDLPEDQLFQLGFQLMAQGVVGVLSEYTKGQYNPTVSDSVSPAAEDAPCQSPECE